MLLHSSHHLKAGTVWLWKGSCRSAPGISAGVSSIPAITQTPLAGISSIKYAQTQKLLYYPQQLFQLIYVVKCDRGKRYK